MARKRIHTIIPGYDVAADGAAMALVIYRDRSFELVAHDEL